MATYEILTQQTLANIINAVVPGTYTPASPRKAMSYDEVVAVKNAIASTVILTINPFIKNDGTAIAYSSRQLVQKVNITAKQAAPTTYNYTISAKAYGATVIIASVHPTEDTVIPGTPIGFNDDNGLQSVTFVSELNGTYLATLKENNSFRWANMARCGLARNNSHYGGYAPQGQSYSHTKCVSLPIEENVYLRIILENVAREADLEYYLTGPTSGIYDLHLKVNINTRTPKNTTANISAEQNITILPDYDDTEGGNLTLDSITDYTKKYIWPDGHETIYQDPTVTPDSSLEIYSTQNYSNDIRLLPIISNVPSGKIAVHRLSVFVLNNLYAAPSGKVFAKNMNKLDVWVKRTESVTPTTKNVTFTVNCEVDSSGNVTPILQVNFTESVGPDSSQFYVTATVNGEFGQFPLTITPADLSGYLQNGNYSGNFSGGQIVNISQLGNNPTITNAQYFNLDNDWTANIYNGVIGQMD